MKAYKKEFGAYITYTISHELYEEDLIVAILLEVPHRGSSCMREIGGGCVVLGVFCFIFSGVRCSKTNKHAELIFFEAMLDLTQVYRWSWGGITLIHLYHYQHESILTGTRSMVGSAILPMVII